ncbi:zinc finger protein 91-like [Bradysia coprophila]|uniref:zinc finger protein 91-like n=1 Tax=Bradysia coprophila TaxID=38358 RepID=UPI00187D74E8|nr:zinc finger protein 91-like [Bradysia coprophila]
MAAPIPLDDEEQLLIKSAKIVDDRYACPLCPRTLARREILVLHLRTHTGKNLLLCPVCDKGFAKPYNLSHHMMLHDGNANVRIDETIAKAEQPDGSFCCTFCLKSFVERKSFRLHLRMHTSNKLEHCPICNQSFMDEDELMQHMPVHGDSFPCIECDQVFNTFKDRKYHTEAVHTVKKVSSGTGKFASSKRPRAVKEVVSDEEHDDEDEQLVNSAELVNGRYNCKFCEKTLANRSTLKLHIRLHLKKKLKVCTICDHGFSKNSHLDRHMKTHFPKIPECKICHATFDSLQEQKAHTAAAHRDDIQTSTIRKAIVPWTQPNGKKSCECRICHSVFDSIAALRKHLDWHAATTDWIQEVDLKSRPEYSQMFGESADDELTNERLAEMLQSRLRENSTDVSKMYRITNGQGWELSLTDSETDDNDDESNERKRMFYNCDECPRPRSFDRLYKLMCHIKADHPNASKQFQCTHCLQCFPNATILDKHLRQQCQNDGKTLHCTMCYSRFTWADSLASHFAVYHQSETRLLESNRMRRPHTCDQCSKSFYTQERLAEHQLRHLPRDKRFACDICDKRFSRYDNLRAHMRSHIPPHEREAIAKTHLCSYCGEGFANSSNLNVHIRKHTGERPFKCDICSSRFRRSCDLTCHRRTHTGEKPYPCLVCGHRFSRSNKLVRHMRIHTGERPYKCTECDRAFTQSNDLTLHIRRHTGDKPFSCLCGERFITNSLLQQHRRTHGH